MFHNSGLTNNNSLQEVHIVLLQRDCNVCNLLFESTLLRYINRYLKDSVPKTPARPVRRGYSLSFAFTLNSSNNCGFCFCKSNLICCAVYFIKLCCTCCDVNPFIACHIKWIWLLIITKLLTITRCSFTRNRKLSRIIFLYLSSLSRCFQPTYRSSKKLRMFFCLYHPDKADVRY